MLNAVETTGVFDLECTECTEDIPFFIGIGQRMGGPLLDLGCGTGRLAIPLARSGIEVFALDISTSVLKRFHRRLALEPFEIRSRIKLVQADMRRFALKAKFRCVICSSNTLLLLGSEQSVGEALGCIGSHLAPGGRIVIDVAAIDAEVTSALTQYPDENIPDVVLSDGFRSSSLLRTHSITPVGAETHGAGAAAPNGNSFSIEYKYFDSDGNLRASRTEDFILLTPEKLLGLLEEHGYEAADTYGWYDYRSFSESERKLLVAARKRESR